MESDVWLEADRLVLEGERVFVTTGSFNLHSPFVRQKNSGKRRALVHGKDDELAINFEGDYPGGVRIDGPLRAEGFRLRVISQRNGKPGLPKKGDIGEMIVTHDSRYQDSMPIGSIVRLWLCIGEGPSPSVLPDRGVYWQPVELGKAVAGTG